MSLDQVKRTLKWHRFVQIIIIPLMIAIFGILLVSMLAEVLNLDIEFLPHFLRSAGVDLSKSGNKTFYLLAIIGGFILEIVLLFFTFFGSLRWKKYSRRAWLAHLVLLLIGSIGLVYLAYTKSYHLLLGKMIQRVLGIYFSPLFLLVFLIVGVALFFLYTVLNFIYYAKRKAMYGDEVEEWEIEEEEKTKPEVKENPELEYTRANFIVMDDKEEEDIVPEETIVMTRPLSVLSTTSSPKHSKQQKMDFEKEELAEETLSNNFLEELKEDLKDEDINNTIAGQIALELTQKQKHVSDETYEYTDLFSLNEIKDELSEDEIKELQASVQNKYEDTRSLRRLKQQTEEEKAVEDLIDEVEENDELVLPPRTAEEDEYPTIIDLGYVRENTPTPLKRLEEDEAVVEEEKKDETVVEKEKVEESTNKENEVVVEIKDDELDLSQIKNDSLPEVDELPTIIMNKEAILQEERIKAIRYCPDCGYPLLKTDTVCPECGANVS